MANESTLGVYKIVAKCGDGAYGEVYLAENILTGGRFALKILNRRCEKRELEGLIRCRECRHENIIRIHHIDRTPDGRLYYTMDAADNAAPPEAPYAPDTLASRLERAGAMPVVEVKKLASALLAGLGALHDAGLVHRDIKPENILFVGGAPVLGDIGLAAFSASASLIGTPAFIRPEVLTGRRPFDEKSDLFALGMVIYCALTGWGPEKYPHLPGDLPQNGADILEFCRAACSGGSDIGELRAILAGKPRPLRLRRRGIIIAVAAFAVLTVSAAVRHIVSARSAERKPPAAIPAALPAPTAPNREIATREWIRERDRLFAKYAIPEEFRARCMAHFDKVNSQMEAGFARRYREHPGAAAEISRERIRELARRQKSDPLYRIGCLSGTLDFCLDMWDPEQTDVTRDMLNGFERFLKERYDAYLAATDGK